MLRSEARFYVKMYSACFFALSLILYFESIFFTLLYLLSLLTRRWLKTREKRAAGNKNERRHIWSWTEWNDTFSKTMD